MLTDIVIRAGGRDFNLQDSKSEIGALLVNNFSREIRFFNKTLKRSHQGMFWKLAGLNFKKVRAKSLTNTNLHFKNN